MSTKRRVKRRGIPKSKTELYWGAGLFLVFLVLVIYSIKKQSSELDNPQNVTSNQSVHEHDHSHELLTSDPYYPMVQQIADQFYCGCGDCGDMILSECVCDMPNGGINQKWFIRDKLVEGHKSNHVIQLVELKYGRKRSNTESQNSINSLTPSTEFNMELTPYSNVKDF